MKTDLLVVGSGPAGLQAAIHASSRKVQVTVVGKISDSSLKKAKAGNYCCIELFSDRGELLERGRRQCEKLGAVLLEEDILKVGRCESGFFCAELADGQSIEAKAVIIAMGISENHLGVKGEDEYRGQGVSYCVECDAGFFKDKKVVVVGNGSAAASGAILMALYARKVVLISKNLNIHEKLRFQLDSSPVIQMNQRWVREVRGDGCRVTGCLLENGKMIDTDGVFINLGPKGALDLFHSLGVALDQEKFSYIAVNKNQRTNVPGILAAGDICGPPFQIAKAVGEGCVAGISASDDIQGR